MHHLALHRTETKPPPAESLSQGWPGVQLIQSNNLLLSEKIYRYPRIFFINKLAAMSWPNLGNPVFYGVAAALQHCFNAL
jgi:hypothetical protein